MMKNIKWAAVLAVFLAVMPALISCGKAEETKIEPAAGNEEGPAVVVYPGEKKEAADKAGQEDNSKNKFLIEQKDADMLLTEALDGTDCRAVFTETLEIGDEGYYTYTVTDPDGEEMQDRLAVNGFTGEVYVLSDGSTEDFSRFSYYNRSAVKNRNINWEGDFLLDNLKVSLVPADEDSFEFTVYKKDEELISGVARIDGAEAVYESKEEKEKLEFRMAGDDNLQLFETGHFRISGQYTRQ